MKLGSSSITFNYSFKEFHKNRESFVNIRFRNNQGRNESDRLFATPENGIADAYIRDPVSEVFNGGVNALLKMEIYDIEFSRRKI